MRLFWGRVDIILTRLLHLLLVLLLLGAAVGATVGAAVAVAEHGLDHLVFLALTRPH